MLPLDTKQCFYCSQPHSGMCCFTQENWEQYPEFPESGPSLWPCCHFCSKLFNAVGRSERQQVCWAPCPQVWERKTETVKEGRTEGLIKGAWVKPQFTDIPHPPPPKLSQYHHHPLLELCFNQLPQPFRKECGGDCWFLHSSLIAPSSPTLRSSEAADSFPACV